MTVADLIEELSKQPQYMRVIAVSTDGDRLPIDAAELSKCGAENVIALYVARS